jgi:hypothetical protein
VEIKININKKNKSDILRHISELVELEETTGQQNRIRIPEYKHVTITEGTDTSINSDYFKIPQDFSQNYLSKPNIQESPVGSWYMFNSYFVSKAILRVLSNLVKEAKGPVNTAHLLDVFYNASRQSGLLAYRGFPKEKEVTRYKDSNVNKLRYFILWPLADMGFISIHNSGNKDEKIGITKHGLELAHLENPKLDNKGSALLSDIEIQYLRSYLKNIDSLGYKENTILYGLYDYLKGSNAVSHSDIVHWFAKNPVVIDYIYKNSRAEKAKQSRNSERFQEQMEKAARAFASGKIALLRELKIIEDRRGSYGIINSFE